MRHSDEAVRVGFRMGLGGQSLDNRSPRPAIQYHRRKSSTACPPRPAASPPLDQLRGLLQVRVLAAGVADEQDLIADNRQEDHTSELQSLMTHSYAVCYSS